MSSRELRRSHVKRQKKYSGGFLSGLLFGLLAAAVGVGSLYLLHLAYSRVGLGVPQYLVESLLGTEYVYTVLFFLLLFIRLLSKPKAIAFFEIVGDKATRREFSNLWGSTIATVKIRSLVAPSIGSYLVGAAAVALYGYIMGFPMVLNYTLALLVVGCCGIAVTASVSLMLSAIIREEMLELLYVVAGTAAAQLILYFTDFYSFLDGSALVAALAKAGELLGVSTLTLSAGVILLSCIVTIVVADSRQRTNRFIAREEAAEAEESEDTAVMAELPEAPPEPIPEPNIQNEPQVSVMPAEPEIPEPEPEAAPAAEPEPEPTSIPEKALEPITAERLEQELREVLKEPTEPAAAEEPAAEIPITDTAPPKAEIAPAPEAAAEQSVAPPPADPPLELWEIAGPIQKEQKMNEQVNPVMQNNAPQQTPANVGAAPGAQPAQRPVRRTSPNASAIQNAAAAARRQQLSQSAAAAQPAAQQVPQQRPATQQIPAQRPAVQQRPATQQIPAQRPAAQQRPAAPAQTSAQRPAAPRAAAPAAQKRPVAASQVDTSKIDFFRTPASDGTTRSSTNANNTPAGPKAAVGGSYAPQTTARPVPVSGMTGAVSRPAAAAPVGQHQQYEAGATTAATPAQRPVQRVAEPRVAPVQEIASERVQPAPSQETFQFTKNPHYEENKILAMAEQKEPRVSEAAPVVAAAAVREVSSEASAPKKVQPAPKAEAPRRKGLSPWIIFIPLMLVAAVLFVAFAMATVSSFLASGPSAVATAIFSIIFSQHQVEFLWVMAESSYGLLYIAAMAVVLLLIFIVLLLLGIHLTRRERTDEWYYDDDDDDDDDEYDD